MKKSKAVKGLAVTAGAAVLLAGGYLLWCSSLEDHVIWEPYSINGVSLEGKTKEEAGKAIQAQFENEFEDSRMTLRIAEEEYQAEIFPLLGLDASGLIDEAYELGHGAWYTRGIDWLRRLKNNENTVVRDVQPTVDHPEKAEEIIEATGIGKVNTLVESSCELKDTSLVLLKGKTGTTPDLEKLADSVLSQAERGKYTAVLECPVILTEPKGVELQPFYEQVYQKAVSAVVDKNNNYAIVPSVDGISFDVKEAERKFKEAEDGETVVVEFDIQQPELTTEELKERLFRDVLGSYTTYGAGTGSRITNVTLAVKACDGVILMPGETFSYNDTLGERTAERGYQTAIVYESGQSVLGIGGGICQVSSTLFAASLYADLEIVERLNHSMTVSYLPAGMDATVSWGGPDYRFRNNTDDPVKLSVTYQDGVLTVQILGTKEDSNSVEVTTQGSASGGVTTFRSHYDGQGNLVSTEDVAFSRYR